MKRSLRRILTVNFLLVAFVPLLLVGLVLGLTIAPRMAGEVENRSRIIAEALANRVGSHLTEPKTAMLAIADLLGDREPDAKMLTSLLDAHVASSTIFEAIYLVGADGLTQATGVRPARRAYRADYLGSDYSQRVFFSEARKSRQIRWSDTFLSTVSGHVSVALAIPVGGKVLVGEIDIQRLSEYLREIGEGEGLLTIIVDRQRQIVASSDQSMALQQTNLGHLPLGSERKASYFRLENREVLGTLVGMENPPWSVLVAQPVVQAYRQIVDAAVILAVGTVLTGLLALVAALGYARRVSRRFEHLDRQAERIAAGHYDSEPVDSNIIELQHLSDSLHRMQQSIFERERALLCSEAKARMQIDVSPVPIMLIERRMNVAYLNQAFVDKLGYQRAEIPTLVQWWKHAFPETAYRRKVAAAWRTYLGKAGSGEIYPARESRVVCKDGKVRFMEISIAPLESEGESYLAILHDITERKRSEEELRLLNANLEDRVEQRTLELVLAKDAAEAATQAKSDFLANMSHEIRTPMNAILGMTDLALRTEMTPKQRDYLGKVKAAAGSLLGVINDILDFSKIEAGKLDIDAHEFRLAEVIDKAVGIVSLKAQEKGLKLQLDIAPDVPSVLLGDPLRLHQVLLNLCNNAVKFTDAGEIVIAVRCCEAGEPRRVKLRFSVRDTGIGMNAEQSARLFAPFSQVDSSSTRKYGGTGLGLAICKQLVELMGGEIGVSSQPAVGSEFHFTLPFKVLAEAPVSTAVATERDVQVDLARLKGLRVLLVEDNDFNQQVAKELLGGVAGIDLSIAGNGEVALARLARERFDLVLMDIQMPVMDGYETTMRIRSDPAFDRLPVIAMTAHAMVKDKAQCLAVGMNDYVTKPFDPAELFGTLAKWAPEGRREENTE